MQLSRPIQFHLFPPGAIPEGAELLMSAEKQRELYPLTTVARNQERLEGIMMLLAAKVPKDRIMRAFNVGWYTIDRIAEEYGEKITDLKRSIARKSALYVQLGIDSMIDDLQAGRVDPDKKAMSVKLIVDTMQLMTGDATSIVAGGASERPKLTADTLRERLANMKPAVPTGSAAENNSTTAAGTPDGPALELPPDNQSGAEARK